MSSQWFRTIVSFSHLRLWAFSKLLFVLVGCTVTYCTLLLYFPRTGPQFFSFFPEDYIYNHTVTPPTHLPNSSTVQAVLVFLHIQKTGGTLLERELVKTGLIGRDCLCFKGKRRCPCKTPAGDTWLVSRFSTGWICGLHADITEYTECLDTSLDATDERFANRRYLFFTVLRNPMERYLSEWLHVRRGGTWHFSRLRCGGRSYSPVYSNFTTAETGAVSNDNFYHPCYMLPQFTLPYEQVKKDGNKHLRRRRGDHPDWAHVPLETFVACPYNLAHNRQVRMLADLTLLGCYRKLVSWSVPADRNNHALIKVQRDLRISAKHSLLTRIRVFGLIEHIVYTQYMMQRSLNIVFRRLLTGTPYVPSQSDHRTHATLIRATLNASELQAVQNRIKLDSELYRFARALFTRRISSYLISDSSVPFSLRRPLRTLLYHRPSLWTGLEYLLLGDQSGTQTAFARRLQKVLIRGFIRRGSIPVAGLDKDSLQNKWANKLTSDFENAGLLTAVTGSLLQDKKSTQIDEEEGY